MLDMHTHKTYFFMSIVLNKCYKIYCLCRFIESVVVLVVSYWGGADTRSD